MPIHRECALLEIKELLLISQRWIEFDRFLRHQNSCIELENFYRDLLNLVFDWELRNANSLFGKNQDSFDLSDDKRGIAVQVTITTSAEKIRNTLSMFVGRHDSTYKRIIFVYPIVDPGRSSADFSDALKGYDFDAHRDRWGFGTILQHAQDMTTEKLERLVNLLRKELHYSAPSSPVVQGMMRHYTLISKRKVDLLYPQVDASVVSALKSSYANDGLPFRLRAVEEGLRTYGRIGTIDQPCEFFEAKKVSLRCLVSSNAIFFGSKHKRTVLGISGHLSHMLDPIFRVVEEQGDGMTQDTLAKVYSNKAEYLRFDSSTQAFHHYLHSICAEEPDGTRVDLASSVARVVQRLRSDDEVYDLIAKTILVEKSEQLTVILGSPLFMAISDFQQ